MLSGRSSADRRYPRLLYWCRASLVACALAALVGCDSSGDSPEPDDGPDDPQPVVVAVPTGTPTLFIGTADDASVFNDLVGEIIEGTQQYFVQFVPETGEAALVGSNESRSFAESISFIRTFDDEVYLLNVADTGARLRRYDTDDMLAGPADRPVPTPQSFDSVDQNCIAVLGDDLYYKVAWRAAMFPGTGFADGPLVRVEDFFAAGGSGTTTELIPGLGGDSPSSGGFVTEACYFNMQVADGTWYDSDRSNAGGDAVTIYTRNFTTGQPTEVETLDFGSDLPALSPFAKLTFDEGVAYAVWFDASADEVELWRFGGAGGAAMQIHVASVAGRGVEGVRTLDADDGFISFVLTTDTPGVDLVGLYDPGTTTVDVFDLGVGVDQLEVLVRGGG